MKESGQRRRRRPQQRRGRRVWHGNIITKIIVQLYSTRQYESSGIYIVCLCEEKWAVPPPPSTTMAGGGAGRAGMGSFQL